MSATHIAEIYYQSDNSPGPRHDGYASTDGNSSQGETTVSTTVTHREKQGRDTIRSSDYIGTYT